MLHRVDFYLVLLQALLSPAHSLVLSVDEKSQIQALDGPSRVCR